MKLGIQIVCAVVILTAGTLAKAAWYGANELVKKAINA